MNNMLDNITTNSDLYHQIIPLLPVLIAGGLLGLIFFIGLHWTVQMAIKSAHPTIWFISSFLLRNIIALAAIYLLTDYQWPRLLACMLGFIIARFVAMTITLPAIKKEGADDAP